MTAIRWTPTARQDLHLALAWWERQRGPRQAAELLNATDLAVRRAAEHPDRYPWVGSVHPTMSSLPTNVRRVLTRRPPSAIYFRHVLDRDEIQILAVRGAGQLPLSADDLPVDEDASM